MDFLKLAENRYSMRKFSTKEVEQEVLDQILEAGRIAPTAHNNQPQRIYVLRSREALEKLGQCTECTFGAPLALVICYEYDESWKRSYDYANSGETDASIVTAHMMLMAASLGVGSTWVAYFNPVAVRETYELPMSVVPHAILPLGYPAENAKPSRLHADRKPMEETVTYL